MKGSLVFSIALLLAAVALRHFLPAGSAERALAVRYLEQPTRIDMPGPPAFASGRDAVLFFAAQGIEGPIEGAVIVRDENILEVVLTKSREGLKHRALDAAHLGSFIGRRTDRPMAVDATTGATISSRILNDAVNERLGAWRTATSRNEKSAQTGSRSKGSG